MRTRVTLFIVAIISLTLLGWWDHRRLIALQEMRDPLNARVVKLGIPIETGRLAKRTRPDRNAEAKLAAAAFIKHHKEREAVKRAGGDPEKSPETAANAPSEWMPLLDSKQVRIVIGEILSDPELDPKSRRLLIGQAVAFFPADDPTGKLSLLSEFSLHLKDTGVGWKIARESLAVMAKENPQAALEWSRNHKDDFPEIIKFSQDVLISGAAGQDPALAFEIIREFGPVDGPGDSESRVLNSSDPKLRSMALTAFRQHLASMDDKKLRSEVEQQAWTGLAQGIAREGFESGSKWLTAANPTPAELSQILDRIGMGLANGTGLANSSNFDEAGHWVEWIANTLSAEESEKTIIGIVNSWTAHDHDAAGKWLASSPDGPTKNAAIRGYAQTIFKHDPETAMQWIMTLPPDERREKTLHEILVSKLGDDPEAAAAFKTEHGLK